MRPAPRSIASSRTRARAADRVREPAREPARAPARAPGIGIRGAGIAVLGVGIGLVGCKPPDDPEIVSTSGFDDEQLWSDNDDWEPTVAADPNGPYVYEATTRLSSPARTVVRVSADHGVTWTEDVALDDGLDAYDPQLAVAADTGCVVFAWLGGPSSWGTYVRTSCDHGSTWSDAVSIAPDGWTTDHMWLTVSPDGADIYAAFNGGEALEAGRGYVAVSHDSGATFAPTFVAGDGATDYWFETGAALAPDGTIYVANVQDSQDYTGPANLVLWRSTDHGASFDTFTVATSDETPPCEWSPGCEFGYFGAQSAVAVDRAGAVLFLWSANDTPGGPNAIYAATSPGGDAWTSFSAPTVLSVDAGINDMPTAIAGPESGDFRVAWQGNAAGDDPATFNTWYQQTADGGVSWLAEPVKLSNLGNGASYKRPEGYAFPYGDYFGLSVDGDGVNYAVWSEGASWTGPGGSWFTKGNP